MGDFMKYKNIADMFLTVTKEKGSKKYLFFEDKVYKFSQTRDIVIKYAKALKERGLEKGDRVGVLLENSPEFIFSIFAIFLNGAIAVPINTLLKHEEISYILNNCEAKFLISSDNFWDEIKDLNVPSLVDKFSFQNGNLTNLSPLAERQNLDFDTPEIELDDIAILIYTSGTTGNPKGAMLTHMNLLSNVDACNKAFKIKNNDRFLLFLPMFHSYAFTTCIMLPTFVGCSIIILRSVMELKKKSFKYILLFKRPTFFLGVPQVFTALSRAKLPKWFIKFLYPVRIHVSGGAPLPEEILKEFEAKFKRPIIEGYGLSEASPVVSVNRLEEQRPYSVGPALPGVEVKVVDDNEVELPIGEVGELIVKGPNVMKGYWGMPEITKMTIKNGWLFTGDMAKLDKDGFIYIVDRKKDLIIVKGINLYPREIEELLYTVEGVEAAAVIGIPDKSSGEIPVAYLLPKEGAKLNPSAIKEYLKKHLANFKIPRHIYIVDELPLTATGKVLKRKLREQVLKKGEF